MTARTAPAIALTKMTNGTTYVCVAKTEIDHQNVNHDFAMTDAKGRAVGARVRLATQIVTAIAADDKSRSGYIMTPEHFGETNESGLRYGYYVMATRDGLGFGASQSTHWFNTPEEAAAKAEKALANSRKRAVKKFS